MFSYLRPHHKRTSSNPSSPADPTHQSFEPPTLSQDHGHPQRQQDTRYPEQPTRPPPLLPPIARIASADSILDGARTRGFERDTKSFLDPARSYGRSNDAQTFSNHQRYGESQRPDSAGNLAPSNSSTTQFSRLTSGMNSESGSRHTSSTNSSSTYVGSIDSQYKPGPTGRRPNGSRLPSPPPSALSNFSTFEPAPRSGKTRLNLLNPMSLLARRRTSQAITQLSAESLVSRQSHFSETFDPRIRGTVVHDFSAPRAPKRNMPYNDVQAEKPAGITSRHLNPNGDQSIDESLGSPWSGGNHTPVFTENFEDEQYPAAGPHVRKASDLTDLPLPKPPYAKGAQKSFESNSTPKSNEVVQKQHQDTKRISVQKPISEVPPPVPPKHIGELVEPRRISIDTSSTPPKSASKKGRPRNLSEVSVKDPAIPKHMKSTSSRFSFDMIGAAEQERLLEDRHRQKALEKKAENENDERMEDDFDDEYNYDDMDDDGLEERIPGVNADYEDEEDPYEFEDEGGNLEGFTFQQSSLASPLSPASPGMVSTPRDANGEVIGFAMSKNSPFLHLGVPQDNFASSASVASPDSKNAEHFSAVHDVGLGLQGISLQPNFDTAAESVVPDAKVEEFPRPATLDDDDLYFDDGIIGGPGEDDNFEFDESVFDNNDTDEYGRPLNHVLAPLPTLYLPPSLTIDPSPALDKILEHPLDEKDKEESKPLVDAARSGGLAPQPSVLGNNPIAATHGLTQDTLAAYQSALAAAAFTAAANGKFRRDSSPPNPTPSEEDNQPGLVTDSSQTSHYDTFSPSYELEDDFDYDDIMEDDAIIAAANAEALANDCDGFYGQEFGFYSAPAAAEAQYANGGYFGPRGAEALNRAQSGRLASREPNLTPITERSEYSNRNSFMSFTMPGGIGSAPSPGLAQLAGMMRSPTEYDGDMSLDALLKLRRGAWGGSQVSLHSSNGSPRSAGGLEDSSPIAQIPPWGHGGAVSSPISNNGVIHRRKNSTFSLVSEEGTRAHSEASSAPASPTMTFANFKGDESAKPNDDGKLKRHKKTGSAESISYSKEDDPVVGERWILERRRTAESGETELLGREVVSGGRI